MIDDEGGYWDDWLDFIRDSLLKRDLISGEDFGLFTITRDPLEAVQVIDDFIATITPCALSVITGDSAE